jgi:5-formyltetrahydrofolate cyclo-ligase
MAAMGQYRDDEKKSLRARLRAAREGLPRDIAARLAALACGRVLALPCWPSARCVVAYTAAAHEIDPHAVVTAALVSGKETYFPRRAGTTLDFLRATPADLCPGPGGLLEPPDGTPLPPHAADTIFVVPGVGFDERGVRLGRGRGCYDRALPTFVGGVRVGLAYECQIVPLLPEAPWDVRMDAVVTDARVRTWSRATEVTA